ncbi:unnamed protein product, partial [Ectocarpus sp. 4 AP-2014]
MRRRSLLRTAAYTLWGDKKTSATCCVYPAPNPSRETLQKNGDVEFPVQLDKTSRVNVSQSHTHVRRTSAGTGATRLIATGFIVPLDFFLSLPFSLHSFLPLSFSHLL